MYSTTTIARRRLIALLAMSVAMLFIVVVSTPARAGGPPVGPGGFGTPSAPPRQDEFGVRTEGQMGRNECRAADVAKDYCLGEPDGWLSTTSTNFVNISKRAFLASSFEYPQGVRVNASFVAEQDDTTVAAYFSAEAYLEGDHAPRMFMRALMDGVPMAPGDAVFATTKHQGLRQMIFTGKASKGIHTIEIQWMMDPGATGYVRDTNLLVRTGRNIVSNNGSLVALTPRSGANLVKATKAWEDVPGTAGSIYVPQEGGRVTLSFAAESKASDGAFVLRSIIGGSVANPNDIVFAQGGDWQSRGFTFVSEPLKKGWQPFKVQWAGGDGATIQLGDRSTVAAAYQNYAGEPTHPVVTVPSGANIKQPITGMAPVPGMSANILVSGKGNGEAAVIFSAEIISPTTAYVGLKVDGAAFSGAVPLMTDGTILGQAKTFVMDVKHLDPGMHTLEIYVGGTEDVTQIGDRTMVVMSETGYVPDLAEAPALTGGRIQSDYVGGIEPLIGPHNVLAILFDPRDCELANPSPNTPPCIDSGDLTPAEVAMALHGPGDNNVNNYFGNLSGGRFSIVNAGVVGWYQASQPESYYWDGAWNNCDYNDSGFSGGHAARTSEAVQAANDDVDFKKFDTNSDGRISSQELAIIVVIPQDNGDGSSAMMLAESNCGGFTPLELDGVTLPDHVANWYTSLDPALESFQFTTAAHELMHTLTVLDDMYLGPGVDHATYSREMSLMSNSRWTTTHLDPIQKLALGWVTPRLVDADSANLSLTFVELSNQVVVLPRYDSSAGEEYYVIENRKANAGPNRYDDGITDSGLAVWHAVIDPVQAGQAPIGVTQAFWDTTAASASDPGDGTMGRWGIRLIRAFQALDFSGIALFADASEVFWDDTSYDLESGACPVAFGGPGVAAANVLAWADCSASGYSIDFTSGVLNTMTFDIDVD